jgi:hypothetical protein
MQGYIEVHPQGTPIAKVQRPSPARVAEIDDQLAKR